MRIWPLSAQKAAVLFIAIVAAFLGLDAWKSRPGGQPSSLLAGGAAAYRIDLNQASRAELAQLPGVGEVLAARLDTDRRENGPYRSVEDLRRVRGIGPVTLARLRPLVRAENETAPSTSSPEAGKAPPRTGKKANGLRVPINVNCASLAELQRLPGIGPKLAARIVAERQRSPFKSADDLRRVAGIGPKTLEKIRPFVATAERTTDIEVATANGDN